MSSNCSFGKRRNKVARHAVYVLVQTALMQDEAFKRANARIEELQAQLGGSEKVQQQGSFLDSMREAVLGKREPHGSPEHVSQFYSPLSWCSSAAIWRREGQPAGSRQAAALSCSGWPGDWPQRRTPFGPGAAHGQSGRRDLMAAC